MICHPSVVEQLGEVTPTGVRDYHHDHGLTPCLLSDLESDPYRCTGGATDEDPFFPGNPAGCEKAVAVGNHHDLVGDLPIVGGGPEVFADAFDQVGTATPTRIDRTFRIPPMISMAGFWDLR